MAFALRLIVVPLALRVCFYSQVYAEESRSREKEIKSAIIFYIAKFVEWPNERDKQKQPILRICLLGQDPLNPFISETVKSKEVRGQRFLIINLDKPENLSDDTKSCEMVFAGREVFEKFKNALAELHRHSLLTVCEMPKLNWGYCSIALFELDNKAKIGVDINEINKAGLEVSSELLDLAVVRDGNKP